VRMPLILYAKYGTASSIVPITIPAGMVKRSELSLLKPKLEMIISSR
jgi:hypothetical protein